MERAAPAAKNTRAGAVCVMLHCSCARAWLRAQFFALKFVGLRSKKHAKVKTTLDDETQRRKHFYGTDAGVIKAQKDAKKKGGKGDGKNARSHTMRSS